MAGRRRLPFLEVALGAVLTVQLYSQTLTTLHSFADGESALPFGALTPASDGSLFGTTQGVGDPGCFFQLVP